MTDEGRCPLCGELIAFEALSCAGCARLPERLYVGATLGQLAAAFPEMERAGLIVGGNPRTEGKSPYPGYMWLWRRS